MKFVDEHKLCFIPNSCSFDEFYNPNCLKDKRKIILVVCRMVENNKKSSFLYRFVETHLLRLS